MQHAAIDLGSKESQICIRDPNGTIIEERKLPTRKLAELMRTWSASRIVMEASAEAFHVADAAKAAGHEVRVVPGKLVRLLGVADRGVKNDQRDARHLSKASWQTDVPSVHIPSLEARELKSICGARDILVETRTRIVNNLRGWLRTQLWRVRSGRPANLPARIRAHAATLNVTVPEHIERQLAVLSNLVEQTNAADKQVAALASKHSVCRRLMTIPGVGPVTAVRFVAAIDDPGRFPSAHRLQSYLGLTPGENSSSERERQTGITKAGPLALRRLLVNAAWSAARVRNCQPMVEWMKQIADRRGKYVAIVALARKLAGIMFALWRDGTTYESRRSARPLLA